MSGSAALSQLSEPDLRALAAAIRTGRLSPPFSTAVLQRIIGTAASVSASVLQTLSDQGCSAMALATCLDLLADAARLHPKLEDVVQLVMTGPENAETHHRSTAVVVADLFRRAQTSVLVAGYAVYQGKHVFEELAKRMDQIEGLQARLFLNLAPSDGSVPDQVARFVEKFRKVHWPQGRRLPELYYDRRSLHATLDAPVSLHAKCVVIDRQDLFISSANFTEAAQNRNIEAGVLVESPVLSAQAIRFFDSMIKQGVCVRAA